ncbi:hypothetical protein WJX84_005262 [Apatococcus fuscideae]|uniref:mitogen-activated protein kinase kinase n=1 Tax=Apatococcus fuscideae TaxID=2026836 RepID=A0AAW1SZY5_9CHLO
MNSAGRLKIADFGVSGQLANSVSKCQTWVGTVTYMSPERIKGDAYGFASDSWSLGLSLLEFALGHFPYASPGVAQGVGLSFWELMDFIVAESPPQLSPGEWSPEFCHFLNCCLQKDPRLRWSASQLLQHSWLLEAQHSCTDLADLVHPLAPSPSEHGDHQPSEGASPWGTLTPSPSIGQPSSNPSPTHSNGHGAHAPHGLSAGWGSGTISSPGDDAACWPLESISAGIVDQYSEPPLLTLPPRRMGTRPQPRLSPKSQNDAAETSCFPHAGYGHGPHHKMLGRVSSGNAAVKQKAGSC